MGAFMSLTFTEAIKLPTRVVMSHSSFLCPYVGGGLRGRVGIDGRKEGMRHSGCVGHSYGWPWKASEMRDLQRECPCQHTKWPVTQCQY